jgi:hypothetical protein
MVSVYTGSFRGVRDQPVTDHEGSIPAGVRHVPRVLAGIGGYWRVFGAVALGHDALVLAGPAQRGSGALSLGCHCWVVGR